MTCCKHDSNTRPIQGGGLIEVFDGQEAIWTLKAYNGRVICSWLSERCLELSRSQQSRENLVVAACMPCAQEHSNLKLPCPKETIPLQFAELTSGTPAHGWLGHDQVRSQRHANENGSSWPLSVPVLKNKMCTCTCLQLHTIICTCLKFAGLWMKLSLFGMMATPTSTI